MAAESVPPDVPTAMSSPLWNSDMLPPDFQSDFFALLFPIGAVFTKEKRWKETKSQTESLDSEPGKPL
jgi:hypothetical protein